VYYAPVLQITELFGSTGTVQVAGNILPATTNTYSLGATGKVWKDAYIGPGTLYVGAGTIGATGTSLLLNAGTSNSVGIGVPANTLPASNLHVYSTGATELRTQGAAGSAQAISIYDGTGAGTSRWAIYKPANSTNLSIGTSTSATSHINVTSTGSIGVGTIPEAGTTLDISGSGTVNIRGDGTTARFIICGATGPKQLNMGYNTTDNYGFINAVELGVAQRNLLLNRFGGNVGIGTTAPAVRLDVSGGDMRVINGDIRILRDQSGGSISFSTTINRLVIDTSSSLHPIETRGTELRTRTIIPDLSGSYDLGSMTPVGLPWKDIYSKTAVTIISDQRQKTNISDTTLGLDFINHLRPVDYKWIDAKNIPIYDENGDVIGTEPVAGIRTHHGFIAQEVKGLLDIYGVDSGLWILADKNDSESQQALRYTELIAPAVKAIQALSAQVGDISSNTHLEVPLH
jgi:hypothetical protein